MNWTRRDYCRLSPVAVYTGPNRFGQLKGIAFSIRVADRQKRQFHQFPADSLTWTTPRELANERRPLIHTYQISFQFLVIGRTSRDLKPVPPVGLAAVRLLIGFNSRS